MSNVGIFPKRKICHYMAENLMCDFLSLIKVFLKYFLFILTVDKIFSLQNLTLSLS